MVIFSVALLASFAACSGTKKEEKSEVKEQAVETVAPDTAKKAAVETVVPDTTKKAAVEAVVPAVKPDEAIKAFKAFAKEYGDAFNNVAKDPAKFSKLANQLNDQLAVINKIKPSLSKKQIADFEAAMKIINEVNAVGKKK